MDSKKGIWYYIHPYCSAMPLQLFSHISKFVWFLGSYLAVDLVRSPERLWITFFCSVIVLSLVRRLCHLQLNSDSISVKTAFVFSPPKGFSFVTKPFPAVEMFTNCCLSSLEPTWLAGANAFTVVVINAVSFVIKKKKTFCLYTQDDNAASKN